MINFICTNLEEIPIWSTVRVKANQINYILKLEYLVVSIFVLLLPSPSEWYLNFSISPGRERHRCRSPDPSPMWMEANRDKSGGGIGLGADGGVYCIASSLKSWVVDWDCCHVFRGVDGVRCRSEWEMVGGVISVLMTGGSIWEVVKRGSGQVGYGKSKRDVRKEGSVEDGGGGGTKLLPAPKVPKSSLGW